MVEINSKSKPQGGFESVRATAPRRVSSGMEGLAPQGTSRAGSAFLRTGKSNRPITRDIVPGGGVFETVINQDDRERVLETDLSPWRMICGLELFAPGGGKAVGTGWFVGPSTIITAGHCVHHQGFFGGWAERIIVSPGRNDMEFPFGQVTATRMSAVDRWIETADPDFDIGCIHLNEPLGDQTGYFSFGTLPPDDLKNYLVNMSGYPADRGGGRQQYFHANRVLHVGKRRVFYDIDSYGGQSGSPVWIHEEEGAPPLAIGIHAYGTGGTPFNLGITANSAPRIIPEVFDLIKAWIAEDNSAGAVGGG